jgi:hypothetical protein
MSLCKGQLVGKLVELASGVSTEEFDDAVVKAKNQLTEKVKQVKREDLEKFFDSQIQTVKDRGCPEAIMSILQNQRSSVLQRAGEITLGEGHVPFLPVIPRTYLSIYAQMPMVRNGDKVGYTYLRPYDITDVVETPQDPYYIFDVEDGEAMLGKAPQDAEKAIKKQGRRGLTEVEVISLGIYTDVLTRHYVDAVGSRYESIRMPVLWLSDDRPKLDWDYLGHADGRWGAASCRSL